MFTDGRSKKVVFLAHCLLNQNAISDGTAVYPAAFRELLGIFLNAEIGLVQLPCPELCCLGLDRGNVYGADSPVVEENTRIRKEMLKPHSQEKLGVLIDYVMQQMEEYSKHGFEIVGIVGANRSPNCGIDTTSDDNREVEGMGVFMQALHARILEAGLTVPMVGIKGSDDLTQILSRLR